MHIFGGGNSFFTTIYFNSSLEMKNVLWREMDVINNNIFDPWLVVSDFNYIWYPIEKKDKIPLIGIR